MWRFGVARLNYGRCGRGVWWDICRRGVELADKHRWKMAFVVLRESVKESRSICVASAEHRWSIRGAYREHAGSIRAVFGGIMGVSLGYLWGMVGDWRYSWVGGVDIVGIIWWCVRICLI